jgi:hypothetical protein
MIEYKLMGKNNSPITAENYRDISILIKNAFPEKSEIPKNDMGERIRETYGINGSAFSIYYRNKGAKIVIPKAYENSIKEKLESIGLKCQ